MRLARQRIHHDEDVDERLRREGRDVLETSIPHRLYRLAVKSTQAKSAFIRRHVGLSMDEWKVLLLIGSFAPVSTKEISLRSTLDKTKVSRTTLMLLNADLVSNHRDKDDRRKLDLQLTPSGKEKFGKVIACLRIWDERVMSSVAEARRNELVADFAAIDRQLDAMEKDIETLGIEADLDGFAGPTRTSE